MSEYRRAVALSPSSVNTETGEFGCVLFTNGEASDGHLIDVRSLTVPDSLPMFVDHVADPTKRAGKLHSPIFDGRGMSLPTGSVASSTPSTTVGDTSVRMTGRVDLEGDGAAADIRRDLFHGIAVGDIRSVSGRWRSTSAPTPRSELDRAHWAHSGNGSGFFFENAIALEGSIVGLGADPSALIGRSNDTEKPEHVREFWRSWSETGDSSGALAALAAQARQIPGLVKIETSDGSFYVPAEVARAFQGQQNETGVPVDLSAEPVEKYLDFLDRLTNQRFAEDLADAIEKGIRDEVSRSQNGKVF